ncbi:hypothetical protein [Streptomyces bottropensis]|uniref:hypothetical protein n=1 Tax=Streptomyces bottropensis TaxID=42235 RepID=UPI0036CE6058
MPPREYIVQTVGEYWPNPDNPCWYVDMLKPDGTLHRHVFPKMTLENLAAEYGIDPTAVDDLLDIAMHQPFAPNPDDEDSEDPAGAAGMLSPALVSRGTVRKGQMIPTTLYTAADTTAAREAHRVRIEHTKAHRVHVVAPKGGKDPLNTIRQAHGIDPDRVAVKARAIEERRAVAQGRAPKRTITRDLDLLKGGPRA